MDEGIPRGLTPLAMLVGWGTMEQLEEYLRRATTVELHYENELIPEPELRGIMDLLGVNPVFPEGTIVLHGDGSGFSELERRRIEDYMRQSLAL